jgi:two-component system, chemotaxis family, sensor kinase CheA
MFIDDEELRGLYKTSATEHIQAIESALMQLEKQPQNLGVLKDLLRSAHTLKGDSRMLGVEDVETLVHQIEECLMPLEKGQANMTDELCDRLYVGLDTIKQLAHTAVTGEANDVNMFYVLATLMGDGDAVPTRSMSSPRSIFADIPVDELFDFETSSSTAIQIDKLFDSELGLLDLDEIQSDSWVTIATEESLFDTPKDLWVHEDNSNNLDSSIIEDDSLSLAPEKSPLQISFAELASELFSTDLPSLAPEKSPLQASFAELASELFPADSTLPPLDPETVFGDFNLIPGTSQPAELDGAFLDDDFTLIPSSVEIGSVIGDVESIAEDLLFSTFDNTLVPLEIFTDLDLPSIDPIVSPPELVKSQMLDLPPAKLSQPLPAKDPVAPTATVSDYQIETIRVEAKQLDALMGQSAEINVINQQIANRLLDLEALMELWENNTRDDRQIQTLLQQIPEQSPLHRQLSRNRQQWEQMGALIAKFKKSIGSDSSRLDLVTSALESGVKKLRLLPVSTIFNLFPRMVRDLAKTQSKEINFAIEGGDILLDKRLLEEIKDPLMHILRNAIDHGIETPTERQQNGKLAAATLMIQVRQTGSQTTIEILDDGRGLDIQRIKATAIKRGLYTKAQLDLMTVDRIQSLIFESGFSTRSRVTELSGRGVGLDIVRTNVERIKGSVDIESVPDRGCTFRIVLSHEIGSSQVMMVDVRGQTYAIPVEFVDRMLLVNKAEIFALGGTPTTQINGQTITVAWLADLLSLPAIAPNSPGEITRTSNSISCLLLQSGRQQLALLVDRIQDRQLVTIESPHPLLKNVPHISGATILGTGEVCLILNPLDLFTTAGGGNPIPSKVVVAITAPTATDLPPTILLVEDSLVIRTQMTRILKGAGYQVTVANDGLEGWEKLQAGQFDLVVSDVEMPRWGGLELTTQIRNHSEYQNLPVILVTTLSKSADRDRGLQAGANAYLTKGDFDQQLLLDTLTRLI